MVARVSTTLIVEVALGYVCFGLYEPVGGNGYVFKELSLLVFVVFGNCKISRTGYIYTYYIFCGDPCNISFAGSSHPRCW